MISAESVEFLPVVKAFWWIARIARAFSSRVQPLSCCDEKSPYARLIVGVPYFASSSSSASAYLGEVLSASMRTAIRTLLLASVSTPMTLLRQNGGRAHPGDTPTGLCLSLI